MRISEATILKILTQILLGLKKLHDNGITHGNLNPSNIIFDENGHIKISDYVCTRLYKNSKKPRDPTYMSPEQLRRDEVRFSTDMWSLGSILHELCCLKVSRWSL